MKIKNQGFTLVETIVSITILSIIMVSVLSIFISSSDMSYKIDINRAMQENTKNIVEHIAEDIRKNGINICESSLGVDCYDFSLKPADTYIETDTLYVGGNSYYLAKTTTGGDFIKTSDCSTTLQSQCILVKNGEQPLSNSHVHISNLQFFISNKDIPKITINFIIKPSIGKGVKPSLIKENSMVFQTTISERIIKNK
ncbi:type II secretion system protein [Candidatus Gracilibacteria bacterium]|nr:type II secretion system protein [Candidatus Gracilibacteria bacterium]NUJ98487.1 type II secretion system protein [Candidatus Gracilibacteria bacterium]